MNANKITKNTDKTIPNIWAIPLKNMFTIISNKEPKTEDTYNIHQ